MIRQPNGLQRRLWATTQVLCAVLAVHPALRADEPIPVVDKGPLVTKSYDVQALLKQGADADTLTDLITNTVLVTSWSDVGGPGIISVNASDGQMKVINVASVQKAIPRLLSTMESIGQAKMDRPEDSPLPAYRSVDLVKQHPGRPFNQLLRFYVVPSLLYPDASQRDPRLADYDSLIRLITNMVAPDSWDEVGGPGSITPWPHGDLLAVVQSPKAHETIATLLQHLSRLPGINSKWTPDSLRPIELPLDITPMGNRIGDMEFESVLYPVHDLLPLETKPVFLLSPRSVGLNQLNSWLLNNREASFMQSTPIPTNAAILITSDKKSAAHKQISRALSALRNHNRLATTQLEQQSLTREIFPPAFLNTFGRHEIYLYGTCDADRQLTELAKSHSDVTRVQLIVTDVSDQGIKELANCLMLGDLTIWSKEITDTALAPLSELRFLNRLAIHGKQITDDVVPMLQKLPVLQTIDLSYTSVTDKCLPQLAQGRQSLMLDVRDTQVTRQGVESFRKSHPQMMVRYE